MTRASGGRRLSPKRAPSFGLEKSAGLTDIVPKSESQALMCCSERVPSERVAKLSGRLDPRAKASARLSSDRFSSFRSHLTMTAPLTQNPSALPSTPQAALEGRLEQLLQSLLEMGICESPVSRLCSSSLTPSAGASDVQESALETSVGGVASGYPGGLIGRKACVSRSSSRIAESLRADMLSCCRAQTVDHLAELYALKDTVADVRIPLDVIKCVRARSTALPSMLLTLFALLQLRRPRQEPSRLHPRIHRARSRREHVHQRNFLRRDCRSFVPLLLSRGSLLIVYATSLYDRTTVISSTPSWAKRSPSSPNTSRTCPVDRRRMARRRALRKVQV